MGAARLLTVLVLAGCASTTVEKSGAGAERGWCDPGLSVLVVWNAAWRADQKEPAAREAAAERGINRFFAEAGCFARAEVRRSYAPGFDRVIYVTVRELGPVVKIGSPSVLEGGTEAVVDVRIAGTAADFRTHWKRGGAFVLRGTGALDEDMAAALRAAFNKPLVQ